MHYSSNILKLPHLPLDLFFMDTLRSSSKSEHDELLLLVLEVGDCAEKKTIFRSIYVRTEFEDIRDR